MFAPASTREHTPANVDDVPLDAEYNPFIDRESRDDAPLTTADIDWITIWSLSQRRALNTGSWLTSVARRWPASDRTLSPA